MNPPEIDEKIGNDKEDIANTVDDNLETFLNENLWKKVAFKLIGYLAWVIGSSFIIVPAIGWDWSAFLIGLRMTILPILWAASDAQSRNREIQQHLERDAELAEERKAFNQKLEKQEEEIYSLKDRVAEKQLKIYELKARLDAACQTYDANNTALQEAEKRG